MVTFQLLIIKIFLNNIVLLLCMAILLVSDIRQVLSIVDKILNCLRQFLANSSIEID